VTRAAAELTQAINALDTHDRAEREAMPTAIGDVARSGNMDPGPERDRWVADVARLESIATDLRLARAQLLEHLTPLRDPLVDVADEAHSLLPERAMRVFDVEPPPQPTAPRPISGIERDLTHVDWVKVLTQNLQWTRQWSQVWAVAALGPCYLLSTTIEHPTPEAMRLRTCLEQARDELIRFINRELP